MPIKGTFDADFEDFKSEVDASTAKLKEMETEADRVGVAVDKAVTPSGGSGLSAMAEGANDLGKAITGAGTAATTAAPAVGALGGSLDSLAQFGVQSVSASEAAAAGFGKMGTAASGAFSSLSLFAQAKLAQQTFELSYAVTRAGMEFFQLDQYVEAAWASLLGYQSASEGAALATGDTLARASAIAGREITNLDQALKIVTKSIADFQGQAQRGRGAEQSAQAFADWRIELDTLRTSGVMAAVTADIDSQAFSLKEIADRYVVSTGALAEYQRQQAAETAFQKETDAFTAEFLKRRDKADQERKEKQEAWVKLVEKTRDVERNQFADHTVGLLGVSALQQATSQKNMEAISKEIDAHNKLIKTIQDELKAATAINTARNLGPGTADAGLDAATKRDAELNRIAALGAKAPTQDLGPLILKTWQDFDAMIIAGAGKGGLAAPPPITVNVSGVFDPVSVRQLADVIGNEFIRRTGTDRFLPAR